MLPKGKVEFIRDAGGCIATRRILDGDSRLKWAVRDQPVNPVDNGWRFFSAADDSEYLNNPENLVVCDYNTVAEIEPAIIAIYLFPIGTDLELVIENGKRHFVDNLTGNTVEL